MIYNEMQALDFVLSNSCALLLAFVGQWSE